MYNPSLPPLSPMLAVKNAAAAIDWYVKALGAVNAMHLTAGEMVVHAELELAGGVIMLSEEDPRYNSSPQTTGKTTVILNLLVENADAAFERAVAAGAKVIFPVQDHFYGYRGGRIEDPFGHQWILSHRIEEVSPQEMQRRMESLPPM
ncbi:VOC family protein [Planctomicrobium sp. SH664]|uniref:VOC family protein n=1 Tax=Planctomicrobium sp. SH664 TaxID=3448125 RepID=UPI003F5BD1DB